MISILNFGKRGLSILFLAGLVMLLPGVAQAKSPTVTTNTATSVTATGATLNGTVNPNNKSVTSVTFDYGLTTGYGSTANATPYTIASGSGNTSVSAALTGLTCNTTYHFRVVATNSSGTPQGFDKTFITTTACPPPTVTSISPNTGSTAGGAAVTITGTNLTGATLFTVGGASLTGVTVVNATTITGTTPAGTVGAQNVVVTTPGGTGTGTSLFTYGAQPTVTSIAPSTGSTAGGTFVTITGTNFTGATAFTVGGASLTGVTVVNATTITGTTPAETVGARDVVVTTPYGTGTGTGLFTYAFCAPPSNIPAGVTVSCVCDQFARASLNPSTIFGSNWIVNTSGTTSYTPKIANSGYLQLTDTNGNESTSATVPGIFPAAGNYISIEFQQYAYNGSGADGMAVTLSDYSQTALPGAFGGSLGYAQKTGINGFNAGWAGVALDEYGNFENSGEGRYGGLSTSTLYPQSVGIRGSGSGLGNATANYPWLGGATALSPGVSKSSSGTRAYGYYYQIVVDARNAGNSTPQTYIGVNRDTAGSGTYSTLVAPIEVFSKNPAQAVVPANWQLSFTGSTGSSTDIHELGNLRICAQNVLPPSGGTAGGFNAIDEAYGVPPSVAALNYVNGRIYTKLVGTPFKLDVAVMSASNQIVTTYAQTAAKNVTVNLVDNSDGVCVLDSTKPNYCSAACKAKLPVTGGSQPLNFAKGATDQGQKQTGSFTLNSAYQNLAVIMSDGTGTGTATDCSTDSFSVRPTALALTTNATATSSTATPIFRVGTDPFALNVTAANYSQTATSVPQALSTVTTYTGTPAPGTVVTSPMGAGTWVAGSLSAGTKLAAAVSGVSSNSLTYSEVGLFKLAGYWPSTSGYGSGDNTSARGVFDSTWTAVDSVNSLGDCVAGSYSNAKDVNGKYGCNFGLVADATFGRFIPDHFGITGSVVTRSDLQTTEGQALPFTYMGEPMKLSLAVTAYNNGESSTQNYAGSFAKLDAATLTSGANWFNAGCVASTQCMGLAAVFGATPLTSRLTIDTTSTNSAVPINTTTAGGATPGWSGGTSYFTLYSTFARAAAPDGAYGDGSTTFLKIGGKPLDSDGVTIPPRNSSPTATNLLDCVNLDVTTGAEDASCNPGPTEVNLRRKLFNTTLRYGRLRLQNIYGSERLPLAIPLQAQYWNSGYFVNNGDDSLTPLPGVPPASKTLATGVAPAGVPGLYFYPITAKNLLTSSDVAPTLCTTTGAPSGALCGSVGVATSKLGGGQAKLQFLAPANNHPGWLDIILPVPSYLLYNWGNCDGQTGAAALNDDNPCARATFGTYKSPLIYRRENY